MERHWQYWVKILFIAILVVPISTMGKIRIRKMIISGQFNEWNEQKEITQRFKSKTLFDIINGGATDYIQFGLKEGIHQQFTELNGNTIEVFIEDFGSSDNAASMFNFKKDTFSDTESLPGDTSAMVITSRAINTLIVLAAIDNMYIEMTVSGFSEDAAAGKAALQFLEYYRAKGR